MTKKKGKTRKIQKKSRSLQWYWGTRVNGRNDGAMREIKEKHRCV